MTGTGQREIGRIYLLRIHAHCTPVRVTVLERDGDVRHGFAELKDALAFITARELLADKAEQASDSHPSATPSETNLAAGVPPQTNQIK